MYTVSQKNCAFLFLSEFCQISMNFNTFWYVNCKMAERVCYIHIFHLTWPVSLHYLVKGRCSKLLPNTGFVTIRLLKFGVRVKRAYCRDNFLAQRPLPDMRRLSGDDFLCFNRTAPRRISTRHRRYPGSREREMRETRRHLGACVRLLGTFRARILTILSHINHIQFTVW